MAELQDVDHYKFRRTRRKLIDDQVRLTGQFDHDEWWPAKLRSLEFLGNPAEKWHEPYDPLPLRYPDLHLAAYQIDTASQEPRRVEVRNQFTGFELQPWQIANPELLLVPARKRHDGDDVEIPEPPQGQHYACYRIIQAPPVDVRVRLQDQFDREPRPAFVRRALFLGVPVRKEHGDHDVADHWNEEIHLVLYSIDAGVTIHDQFGSQPVDLGATMLGVPTFKRWLP